MAPPEATCVPKVAKWVKKAKSPELVDVWVFVEAAPDEKLTEDIVLGIGLGVGEGIKLADCTTAKQKAKVRSEIAVAFFNGDPRLRTLGSGADATARKKSALLMVQRKVDALLAQALAGKEEAPGSGGVRQGADTIYVQSQTEEESSGIDKKYTEKTMMRNKAKLAKMYNLVNLTAHLLPTIGQQKRMSHWASVERTWCDPTKLPLKKLKRSEGDRPLTCIRRRVFGMVLVSAGQKVDRAVHFDNGAGKHPKHGTQWCNANVAGGLLAELEEYADKMEDPETWDFLERLDNSIFKASDIGKKSLSLAMREQMHMVRASPMALHADVR